MVKVKGFMQGLESKLEGLGFRLRNHTGGFRVQSADYDWYVV